jgi:glycosyltransferase involved in cell wall biosynthesis
MLFSKDKSSSICIVASNARDQVLSRKEFIRLVQSSKHSCTIISPDIISVPGIRHKYIFLDKRGMNFFSDLSYFLKLFFYLLKNRSETTIFFAAKPRFYGSIICFLLRRKFILYINGMGNLYIDKNLDSLKSFLRNFSEKFIKYASIVVVQNEDDKLYMSKLIDKNKLKLISGSGVDTEHFVPKKTKKLYDFAMVSRLIKDKGVFEFLSAANSHALRDYKFLLIGPLEDNSSITPQILAEKSSSNLTVITEYRDAHEALSISKYAVLPSYREGCSRYLLEALSMGVPILTSDTPGCRDFFNIHNLGRLFLPRSVSALQDCILGLGDFDYYKQSTLSREIASKHFSSKNINKRLFDIVEVVIDG